jgi:anaerobic magnesium-protoporphyrin IX monomethyl ester cyclase
VTAPARRVALVQAPAFDAATPSNALALLSAHLRRGGHEPLVFDASLRVRRALERSTGRDLTMIDDYYGCARERAAEVEALLELEARRIVAASPDLVGFSVLTMTEDWTLALAAAIKRLAPSIPIVLGGAQCLREAMAFELARRPGVDGVVLGEADVSFMRLVAALRPGTAELPVLPGLLARRGEAVVDGGDAEALEDLDALPFLDFSGFDMTQYSGERIFLSTSRGCVRKCAFCTHIVHQKVFRVMGPERTVAEIRHQLAAHPGRSYIEFNDSLVNGDVGRLARISELLVALRTERLGSSPRDFGWSGMAILHPTMSPALLRKLRRGGCVALKYGFESASQRVVDLMRKDFRVADAERVIADTRAAGIEPYLFILVGFPGETEDDFQMTLDFIARNAGTLGGVMLSSAEVQKGSHLDVHAAEYGVRLPLESRVDWTSADGANDAGVRARRLARALALIERLGLARRHVFSSRTGSFAEAGP